MANSTFVPRCPKCHNCKIVLHPLTPGSAPETARKAYLDDTDRMSGLPVYCLECSWVGKVTEVSYERL